MVVKNLRILTICLYAGALVAVCLGQGPRSYFGLKPAVVVSADDDESSREAFETALIVFERDWAAKEQITQDIIGGRLTLLEGAARFHALYARRPSNRFCIPKTQVFPGDSEGERLCRQIIQWVKMRLDNDPSRDQVVGRLTQELQAILNACPDCEPLPMLCEAR
jgi:hypothetical protein